MEKLLKQEQVKSNVSITSLKKRIGNIPVVHGIRKFFKFLGPRVELFHNINKLYVLLLLTKAQYYQPLYNFAIINKNKKKPERMCIDRADVISYEMKARGQGRRILDIGCNLGFFSLYFADRDYTVTGIDQCPKHITICKILERINQKKIDFSVGKFSQDFLEHMQSNQYDIVFIFSVIHHIIYDKGLDYTQNLMTALLEKIPVLFVELATVNEPSNSNTPWQTRLPQDELTIFAKCSNPRIDKLGYFSTNREGVQRPLYRISRNQCDLTPLQ